MSVAIIGPKFYAWDNDTGKPLAFGKVYTYQSGTNTPKATFTTEGGETQNANPTILNGAGYADIFLNGSYKIVVKDADDVEVWTSDPVSDPSQLQQEWVRQRNITQVNTTTFTVDGELTDEYVEGVAVRVKQDSGFVIGTVASATYVDGKTTVTLDFPGSEAIDASAVYAERALVSFQSLPKTLPKKLGNHTIYVGSVAEGLSGLNGIDGQAYNIIGWHVDSELGGGEFVYRAGVAKSEHDGGKYISPTVPPVSEQPGADLNEQIENFNAGNGETDSGGDGVYVRTDPILSARSYGAQFDGSDDTAAIASFDALSDPKGSQLVDGSAISPTLTADVDAITASGPYYTDGTSANRPLDESGTVTHIQVDTDTATQQYVTFDTNQALFRGRTGGVWGPWYEVTAQEIFIAGWPTIEGDNLLSEVPTNTTTSWTIENASTTFTSDGSTLTLDNSGGGLGVVNRDVAMTDNGDFIIYAKLSAESIVGSYNTAQLGGPGDAQVMVSLGYNWNTGAGEQNRISAAFRDGAGTIVGIAGPVIDYSVGPVEIALLYNDEFQAGTLFVKESGAWVGYGVVPSVNPYRTKVRLLQGGDIDAALTVHELFIAKPNIVSVGDSITEGATLYAPDPAEGLTNYASTWQAYANLYPNVRNNIIVNKGIGSENSSQIDVRMNSIMADAQPQVVFLQASANDYGANFTLSERTVNIQNSINKITNAGANVALLNAIYPNADAGAIFPAAGDYYRNWWETELVNIENANIKIDWMEGSGILSTGTYMDTAYTQADGVHPNPAGYTLLGDYIQSLEP